MPRAGAGGAKGAFRPLPPRGRPPDRAPAPPARRAGDHLGAQFHGRLADAARPWNMAVLWDTDCRLAAPVLADLRRDPALWVGDNEPYSGRFPIGYSIPFHAARSRLPHVTFECART